MAPARASAGSGWRIEMANRFEQHVMKHLSQSDDELVRALTNMGLPDRRLALGIIGKVRMGKSSGPHPTHNLTLQEEDIPSNLFTAPYRFVALNDTVAPPEELVSGAWKDGTLHNLPLVGGLSGTLDIDIKFDNSMLIGEPNGDVDAPLKMGKNYVIPGATLRGLIRSTMEIAANARLSQTNLHRRYGIRDFEHSLFREENRKDVKAGWLRPWQEGDAKSPDGTTPDYVIEPCKFYLVKIRDFAPASGNKGVFHLDWLKKSLIRRYGSRNMLLDGRVDFSKSQRFSPLDRPGPLDSVIPDENGGIEGVYVFANTSPAVANPLQTAITSQVLDEQERATRVDNQKKTGHQKKTECVFETERSGPARPVNPQVWHNFIANNSSPSRHAPQPTGNWKELRPTLIPEGRAAKQTQPARIPVFWVGDEHHVADFGLTRVFKRAHLYSVADVLHRTGQGKHKLDLDNFSPDFVEALFGFVHEPEETGKGEAKNHLNRHLKGRVAFGFASLDTATPATVSATVQSIMSAPKPSFSPFYLATSTGNKDWSDSTVQLAGRKRYPARGAKSNDVRTWLEIHDSGRPNDARSTLRFLEPTRDKPLRFKAQIRLHNVTQAELGAILWCLTFGGDDTKRHMIGRAKTAGAGQARIAVTQMVLETNAGDTVPDAKALVEAFRTHMRVLEPAWPETAPVKDLLATADPQHGAGLKLDYLLLKNYRLLRKAVYNRESLLRLNTVRPRLLPP